MTIPSCTDLWFNSWLVPELLPHASLQLSSSFAQFLVAVGIMVFLRLQQRSLGRNPHAANRSMIILPIHNRVLAAFLVVTGLQFVVLALPAQLLKQHQLQVPFLAFVEAGKRGVLELVAFLLLQQGAGANATARATLWAGCWAACVFVAFFLHYTYSLNWHVMIVYHLGMVILYVGFLLLPPKCLFRRPALHNYAQYWSLQSLILLVADVVLAFSVKKEGGYCCGVAADVISALFTAYVLYRTLLLDSRYWQGLHRVKPKKKTKKKKSSQHSKQNSTSSDMSCSLTAPLMGIHLGRDTARSLATFAELENCGQVCDNDALCCELLCLSCSVTNRTLAHHTFVYHTFVHHTLVHHTLLHHTLVHCALICR
jgi:hypothetical protein